MDKISQAPELQSARVYRTADGVEAHFALSQSGTVTTVVLAVPSGASRSITMEDVVEAHKSATLKAKAGAK